MSYYRFEVMDWFKANKEQLTFKMPRCKNCKEKFEATYFNEKYCKKDECKSIEVNKLLKR